MQTDLDHLARRVASELAAYGVPEPDPDQLGTPLPPDWFEARLEQMRRALVPPYLLDVRDYDSKPGEVVTRSVAIVADDSEQALLAFDPSADGDFVLVWRFPDRLALSNIRGDAVGCFLSR